MSKSFATWFASYKVLIAFLEYWISSFFNCFLCWARTLSFIFMFYCKYWPALLSYQYAFFKGGGRDSPSVRPNMSADGWTSVTSSKARGFAPTPVDASKFKIKVILTSYLEQPETFYLDALFWFCKLVLS